MNIGKGLGAITTIQNPDNHEKWCFRIGQIILNMGSIEYILFAYLKEYEANEEAFLKNINEPLHTRINRLVSLLSESESLNASAMIKHWKYVNDELREWRNRIAHNPLIFSWKEDRDPENDPADCIGIPNIKEFRKSNEVSNIPYEMLEKLVLATEEHASELQRLLDSDRNQLYD